MNSYVLDACALIAYLGGEEGADVVEKFIESKECKLYMHSLNLYEVYYDYYRNDGKDIADKLLSNLLKFPIIYEARIDLNLLKIAAEFKVKYKVSVADTVALALADMKNAVLMTSDHHEFDEIEKVGRLKFCWIR
jgi:predicted nucleic acid-binding protein